jgi:hypothetical protein
MQTLKITRAELAAAAFKLGVRKPNTVRQWFSRGNIPYRMQIKLTYHFGAHIEIIDFASHTVASITRPKSISDICREKFLTPSGLS